MTSNRLRLLAIASFALLPAALQAAPLEATALYREKARDCRAVDLGTWAHPTRKVMEGHRVEIQPIALPPCSDGSGRLEVCFGCGAGAKTAPSADDWPRSTHWTCPTGGCGGGPRGSAV